MAQQFPLVVYTVYVKLLLSKCVCVGRTSRTQGGIQLVLTPLSGFVWAGQTQCQQELDQALERISKMPFSETRGPLEDLYAVHIPNCDKKGQYNLKQVSL